MAVTITIEDVKKAKAYMPSETKRTLSTLMARLCVATMENDAGKKENEEVNGAPLPPIRIEDRVRRLQFLHGVLAGWYFGGEFETEKLRYRDSEGIVQENEIPLCMTVDALDKWLEGHPVNQLERLKKEKAVANKVYDLLYDFKAFELMLNGAIRDRLDMANDPAIRMAEVLAAQTTPESFKEALDLLKEYRKEIGVSEDG